ncbi:MAG: hypothetical protein ACYC69_08885 [Thermodesulfovibrionales bacterium]
MLRVLHLLVSGGDALSAGIIKVHGRSNEVIVIDLSQADVSYEKVVEEIVRADRVISW